MDFLKYLLAPPKYQDEDKTYQTYLLNIILLTLVAAPIPFIIYLFIWKPGEIYRTLIFITFAEIINITLLAMMRRGFVRQAAIAHIVTLWLIFAVSSATRSGIYGIPYALGNGLVITVTGILLGKRSAQAVIWLVIAQGGVLVYAEFHGWAPKYISNDPVYTWAIAIVLFAIIVNMQTLASNQIHIALNRAQISEERYRLISQVSSDYTFSTELDSEGNMRLVWVAGAFEKITGYTFEEYIASGGWLAHLHPDDVQKDAHDVAILRTNQAVVTEIRAFKKNGDLSWVRVYSHPVWNEKQNRLAGIVGAVQDITQQKLGEAALTIERDLLQIFMDNTPNQVYFKDTESRFVRINQAQANFLGIEHPKDAIGKTDMDFQSHELAREFLAEEKQIIETGQPVLDRIEFNPTKDGNSRWLSTSKVPAKNEFGHIIGTIGMSFDITQQKLAEEQEIHRREILEKVIGLGKKVTEVSDLRTTVRKIWNGVRNELDFDRLGIYLYDPANNLMRGTYGTNNKGEISDEWDSYILLNNETIETSAFIKVLQNPNGMYFTRDYETERNITSKEDVMYGVKDYIAVAAWAGNKPVAVLCLDQNLTHRAITDDQLEALRLFTGYAGLAIENARLNDAIQNELNEKRQAEEIEQQRRQMLEKVVQLGKQVAEVSDLRITLEKIWYALHEGLGFDRVGIFAYQSETNLINRLLGTDINGNRDDTPGESIPASEWHSFQIALEKPDGFYFTHNFSREATIPEGQEMYAVKDYATVAAWAGGKPVAVIAVDQLITQRSISDQQLEALRLFAGYAGLAIENARLKDAIQNELDEKKRAEENEQQHRIMLEKVVQLGKSVAETTDFHTTLKRIWDGVRNGLGFDRAGIWVYIPESNSLQGSYGTDQNGNLVEEWDMNIALEPHTSFYQVLKRPDGFFFTNDYESTFAVIDNEKMKGVKSNAAVACWSGDKPMAIISVDNLITNRPITDIQLETLRLFSSYAGLSIQNSRLNHAIENELDEKRLAEENEQRRRIMLEKVVQLGKQVTVASDFQSTLKNIWNIVRYDLDFDRVGLFLYNAQENTIDGTYGTDNEGKMWDAWHVRFTMNENGVFPDAIVFHKVLERPDGYYFTKDYTSEFSVEHNDQMIGVKYYAVVAVWADDKPVALISVDQLVTQHPILDEQLEALRLFAGYAGYAIENSRLKEAILNELIEQKHLEENEQHRRVILEKVMKLGQQVTEVSDLRTTLRKIWHGVRHDLDFDRVGLFTYDEQENLMIGAYGTDLEGNLWEAWHVRFGLDDNALFYKVLSRPDGFFFTEDFKKELNLQPDHEMAGVKHAALVAVWAGNKPMAIISVDQLITQRPITNDQLEALRLFAGYAGLAISNAHLNDVLEGELSQRKTFIDELEAKNAELERFTYTASHDLKSPLVTITGFLGYLEKDALAGNQERMKSSIARINSAAEKMQALLNDLLELSRIGRLMNPPEDVPFAEIVNEALDRVRGRLDEINAFVEVERNLPKVRVDRVRLVEVVQNLIENAVKYSKPNVKPRIEIGSERVSENGHPIFHVRDNGMGIDPQYHERIFGLFNKLDPQSEGTGIGLSLVKRIIEVHGGRVWVESEKGKGATFYFSLPTS